jgi:hypothetical protein
MKWKGNERPRRATRDPLPKGWLEDFFAKADFEQSFQALEGRRGFFPEALRGRIRSLELRLDEGWQHLDAAYKKSARAPETLDNLIRQFTLNVWCFEHALIEGPLDRGATKVLPSFWLPELPPQLLKEYPEVKTIIGVRKYTEALLRLHLGRVKQAASLFEELVEERRSRPDEVVLCYMGLAACHEQIEGKAAALRRLEEAGLATLASDFCLLRARAAGSLQGMYRFLGREEEAKDWEIFLGRLSCPAETKVAFLGRGELILERSQKQGGLVLL